MLSTIGRQDSSLLTKSPKPGVSTTVKRKRTPFSSISALIDWMETVFGMMSRLGPLRSRGGYREVLNKVFTSVDFPSPDSPRLVSWVLARLENRRTNNHDIEVESFTNTLAVPLVWQVCKPNVSSELSSHNVTHVAGLLGGNLGIAGAHALWYLEWRGWHAIGDSRRRGSCRCRWDSAVSSCIVTQDVSPIFCPMLPLGLIELLGDPVLHRFIWRQGDWIQAWHVDIQHATVVGHAWVGPLRSMETARETPSIGHMRQRLESRWLHAVLRLRISGLLNEIRKGGRHDAEKSSQCLPSLAQSVCKSCDNSRYCN